LARRKLLSRYVDYARSANAIDETRKDLDRVGWGGLHQNASEKVNGIDRLMQWWFAGNHADVGGSYAETESRLSDIALQWMIEQATGIPDGLRIGPVIVNGKKLPGTGDSGTPLELHPAVGGVGHCEIAATRDMLDGYAQRLPGYFRRFLHRWNWEEKIRDIPNDAPVHPTVKERFKLDFVAQCAGSGRYRPGALKDHDEFKSYYPPVEEGREAAAETTTRRP
jgi:Uncharacterized alpha/beta hydrolase domain (DUF2235)